MKKAFVAEVVSNETSFVEEKISQHKSNIKVIAKMVLKDQDGTEYTYNKNSGVSYLKKAGDKMLMIKNEDGSVYFHDSDEEYIIETKKKKFTQRFNMFNSKWTIYIYPVSILSLMFSSLCFLHKNLNPLYFFSALLLPVFTFLIISLVDTYRKSSEYSVDEEGRKIILDYINSEKNEDGSVKLSEVEKDILVEKEEYLMGR